MMTKLREIRMKVLTILSKYEAYLVPFGKLIFAMIVFCTINSKFGFMTKIAKFPFALILGLFCSFMPMSVTVVLAAILTLAHAYAISLEFAAVLAVVYIIMFLLFFRFSPKDMVAVLLTPLCFVLKIPYVIPMSFGLIGTPASSISVACGTIIFYILRYMVKVKATFADSAEDTDIVDRLKALFEGIIKNKEMLVCAAAFALIVLVVYIVRRLSINYAWTIAMVTGALVGMLTILVGDVMYKTDISIVGLIFGTILACLVVRVLQFILFDVDYSRTEKVQFEDDDYYYYVKAVPKVTVGSVKDGADSKDSSRSARSIKDKMTSGKPSKGREKKVSAAEEKEDRAEAPSRNGQNRSGARRPAEEGDFARERAAYEARQAEIARRREAAKRREERLRNEEAQRTRIYEEPESAPVTEESTSDEIVQEEDSDLGLSRRMAYQRRKLEERLNRD